MKHPKNYWKDKENMMREAKKYSNKEEFQKGNLTAFLAAYKYGYIDDMYWFFNGNQTAYRAALKMGVIDDFFVMNDYVQ